MFCFEIMFYIQRFNSFFTENCMFSCQLWNIYLYYLEHGKLRQLWKKIVYCKKSFITFSEQDYVFVSETRTTKLVYGE